MEVSGQKLPTASRWHLGPTDKPASRVDYAPFAQVFGGTRSTTDQSPRQVHPPVFFARPFHKEPGRVSQKTTALAVPQNVTAQGFMPPVEKGMDSPGRDTKHQAVYDFEPMGKLADKKPWYMP